MTPPLVRQSSRATSTIWKFVVEPWTDIVEMPRGARPLHVAAQAGQVCVWAEIDRDREDDLVLRRLSAVPTGGVVMSGWRYVGTAHVDEGDAVLVFHVYDGDEV